MTDRHTASSINDDALDALYESLDAAQQTELARQLATCNEAFASATLRAANAEQTAADLRRRLEGTHTRVLALAADLEHPKHRGEYGIPHPVVAVMIRDALGGEAPAATELTTLAELGDAIREASATRDRAQERLDELDRRLNTMVDQPTSTTGPFIDRPFRSHRTPTPAHACTYGERCPNCRD